MFEEGQLYSPVSAKDGQVTVHLADDHPGAGDAAYQARRNEIAALALAWKPGEPAPPVRYSDAEQEVWRTVARELAPKHDQLAIAEFLHAKAALDLPTDAVPSLDLVSDRLRPLTGFHYAPAAGLVPLRDFYGSLSHRLFHSTQYVRHEASPLYTPEPDIIHEVVGHGHLLATPTFSELHRLTGEATHRLTDEENLRFLSRVFWFTRRVRSGRRERVAQGVRRGNPLVLRRDRRVPRDGAPPPRPDRDGHGRLRHHALPARALPSRVARRGARGGRRVLPHVHGRLDRGAAGAGRGRRALGAVTGGIGISSLWAKRRKEMS